MAQNDDDKFDKHENDSNEYQFNDEQDSTEYEYEEKKDKDMSPKKLLGNKRTRSLIIVVVVVIILFIIYEISRALSGHGTTMKKPATTSKLSVNPAVSKTTALPFGGKEKATAALKAKPSSGTTTKVGAKKTAQNKTMAMFQGQGVTQAQVNAAKTKENEQLTKLQQQQRTSQTQLMNLQGQMSNLNTQLSSVNQNLKDVSQNLQVVKSHVIQDREQKKNQVLKQRAVIKAHKHYFVDAVIPGRAWLKGADGTTVTVAVGDKLPGYGKVTNINPYSGVVMTEGGAIPYAVSGG